MKLRAKTMPYSSTVGGGLTLVDETGAVRFMVAVFGTTAGITKEEAAAISRALLAGVIRGIEVPDRTS